MALLKIKSLIYKYTGVYLAHKEECEFLKSKEYRKDMIRIMKKNKDMGMSSTGGLLIGMWQAHHGFARPGSFLKFKRPRAFWSVIGWFADLFTVLKWDAIRIYRTAFPPKPEKIKLSKTDSIKVVTLLENPPKPNKRLKKAFKDYEKRVKNVHAVRRNSKR